MSVPILGEGSSRRYVMSSPRNEAGRGGGHFHAARMVGIGVFLGETTFEIEKASVEACGVETMFGSR